MTVTAFLKKSNLTCQTEGMNIITMDLCTFSVAALDEQRDHIQFGRTEYKIHLLSYIRLRWTTSEFTGRLQNLLDDFRIYWTTSDFYWTTWVLEVKISSATWPGGSVLTNNHFCEMESLIFQLKHPINQVSTMHNQSYCLSKGRHKKTFVFLEKIQKILSYFC